jgi:peptidoglycan hydrolase CwlO-like protein
VASPELLGLARAATQRIFDPWTRIAFTALLDALPEELMADLQQALTDLDGAVGAVRDDHARLQAEIDRLAAAGTDTAALQAAADAIEERVSALNSVTQQAAQAAGTDTSGGAGTAAAAGAAPAEPGADTSAGGGAADTAGPTGGGGPG